jgi:hypothetical protein
MAPSVVLFSNAGHRDNIQKTDTTMKTPITNNILLACTCAALGAA